MIRMLGLEHVKGNNTHTRAMAKEKKSRFNSC